MAKPSKKKPSLMARFIDSISFNIGTIIFGAIFIYMIISVILYLTTEHVSTYQVTAGPLAKNQTYVGLAVRSEEVVYSNSAGFVTYYAADNSRVKQNGIVYGIGESATENNSSVISDALLETLRVDMASFASSFDTNEYNDIYRFKYEIDGKLLQSSGVVSSGQVVGTENITVGNQTVSTAVSDGLILYSMDGYESFDVSSISNGSFNSKNYQLQNLKTKERVEAGTPIYRIITDENWSVYIPLTDRQVIQLADRNTIRVKFLKDDITQSAGIVIHTSSDGSYYAELKFSSGVIRYSSERFIDLELVTNTSSGLKIPVSAIVKKQFYTIPTSFSTKGGDSNDTGFLIQRKTEGGNSDTEFVHLTIYENKDDMYYVDPADIQEGDIILQTETNKRYIVGEMDSLEGVYCINKGYAVFRKIVIIDKNDEFCIVETQTPYGLSQFDHIVEDSSTVREQEILY